MFFEKKKPSSSPNSFQHGMLQVSRYVEDMGGTIKCIVKKDDEEDREIYKGIPVFRFALPAGKEVQKRTILVADDNQGDREMMQKILTRAGMRVLMAEKPEEALTIAQNETIHGAVVDIDFEDEHNGIWLLRKLKELKPEVIKIVVSGAESSFPENWQDDARKYGAAQIYDKAQYRAEHIIQHFEI